MSLVVVAIEINKLRDRQTEKMGESESGFENKPEKNETREGSLGVCIFSKQTSVKLSR